MKKPCKQKEYKIERKALNNTRENSITPFSVVFVEHYTAMVEIHL